MVISNQPQELRQVQREYFRNWEMCDLFNQLANRARTQEDYEQAGKHELKEQEFYNAYIKNIKDGAVQV